MLVLILKKNNKIREFVESSTCFVLALITSVQFFFFAAGKKAFNYTDSQYKFALITLILIH